MSLRVLLVVFVAGCAMGTATRDQPVDAPPNTPHDAPRSHDGPRSIDAPPTLDAFVPHDGPPPAVDAGNPLFCSDNTQCVVPATCCFVAACVPGTAVGVNLCFPM